MLAYSCSTDYPWGLRLWAVAHLPADSSRIGCEYGHARPAVAGAMPLLSRADMGGRGCSRACVGSDRVVCAPGRLLPIVCPIAARLFDHNPSWSGPPY